MQVIQHIELTTGQAAIEFNSIPTDGTDLMLYISARNNRGFLWDGHVIRFNGDTNSSNYSGRQLIGVGTSPSSNVDNWAGGFGNGSTSTANTFSNNYIHIPNYRSSTAKSLSIDSVVENNDTTTILQLAASIWTGTAAITSLRITLPVGTEIVTGSSATLYKLTSGSSGGVTVS